MERDRPYDVVVIGAGAAGLNAALVLARARRAVLVCDDGAPRNASAAEMHGFVGLDGTSPAEFLARARADVLRYPTVAIHDGRVDGVRRDAAGGFRIELASGAEEIAARRVLIATGMTDVLPQIDGLEACWGRSVFVCPYCEGWEVRDRRLAVWAPAGDAVGLAQELYQWSRDVIVFVDDPARITSDQRRWLTAARVRVVNAALVRIAGRAGRIETLEPSSGDPIACDALFVSANLRQSSDLPERLGCEITARGSIRVDDCNRTSVRGAYAAGDAVTRYHQVALAAASGVAAAIAINDDLTCDDAAKLASAEAPD